VDLVPSPTAVFVLVHMVVVAVVFVRLVMSRPPTGVALAWLTTVALLPVVGVLLYLLFGERRTGSRRAERFAEHVANSDEWMRDIREQDGAQVDWSKHPTRFEGMGTLGRTSVGFPAVAGNTLEILDDTEEILRALIADIDKAEESVHLAFYIWHPGGTADDVLEAVIRAAERGVTCRVLVDTLGSSDWLKSSQPKRLLEVGVEVRPALSVHPLTTLYTRGDLRLHRKIVVIDGDLAYTGSANLLDPRFFKQDADVGQWIDAMVRLRGTAVEPLFAILLSDWCLETGEDMFDVARQAGIRHVPAVGDADVQAIPSGPGQSRMADGILQMLLKLIYAATDEIVLTTPYFVPDDSMLRALRTAAAQGIRVDLIVPANVDSFLVRQASRSYYEELMQAGVHIQEFDGGLLHTKSITVDGATSMFGTVNLDMRSLWLNYEVTLFVYDVDFTRTLRELQDSYLRDCQEVDLDAWRARPLRSQLLENTVRLVSPLL